ncbi:MAG TPA: cytochrome P450 [Solirubrobacteraceae bacterium]|jgi:cytochrome P450|nr:cytochrome P450 [Solirubrobacteraceae bacterium]
MAKLDEALADDLLAPAVNANPYPYLAALRERDPVHWSGRHNAWVVTRYDDVASGLKDKRLSSDRVQPLLDAMDAERRARVGPVMEMLTGWMVVTDPPTHTRLRRLAANAFQPQRVNAMEAQITALVDELLDDFIAGGHSDLIAHFAYPLPATVIGELIGAPPGDRDRFKGWSNDLAMVAFGAGGEARDDRHERATRGLDELFTYFEGLIERSRREPGEDMISNLLEGDGSGDRLSNDEMKAMCALMLFAGHETTTTTIASAVMTLLQHPDQLELIRAQPELAGGAVEEALRYEGAIKVLIRWVVEDLEVRGREIKVGQRVYLLPSAANRDPEKFPDPDRVDITRSPNAHIAFGRGVHTCIGAQLARLEMRVALARIVDRLPGLRFANDVELEWVPSLASRGLKELRVEHDAAVPSPR